MNRSLFLIFLLLGIGVPALRSQDCFPRLMAEGRAAYEALDFETAKVKFEAAGICPANSATQTQEAAAWLEKTNNGYIEAIKAARDEALRAKAEAERQARISEAGRLAFLANQERENGNTADALALAFRAHELVADDPPLLVGRAFGDAAYRHSLILVDAVGERPIPVTILHSPDAQTVLILRDAHTLSLFQLPKQNLASRFFVQPHQDLILGVAYSPDGQAVLSWSRDNSAKLFDVQLQPLANFTAHIDAVTCGAFAPDGKAIATGSRDKTARIWDLRGTLLATLSGHQAAVLSVDWSPDGQRLLTRGADKTLKIWDRSGRLLADLNAHQAYVYAGAFSPDGTRILSAGADRKARLWDIKGNLLAELGGHTDVVTTARFSPDGRRLLTASADGSARLWSADGTALHTLPAHRKPLKEALFSPDGQSILTCADDGAARLWNLEGQLVANLSHGGAKRRDFFRTTESSFLDLDGRPIDTLLLSVMNGACFSPDGRHILTASGDRTARVWDRQGNLITNLSNHSASVVQAGFSPDNYYIITVQENGGIQLCKTADTVLGELRRNPPPPFTEEQKQLYGLER